MRRSFSLTLLFSSLIFSSLVAQDWPNLARFQDANTECMKRPKTEKRVVFMGNSITEGWLQDGLDFFDRNTNYVNRGIGGQTTPQMLIRFKQDVINIEADIVVILAGINDIAHNTGPSTIEMTFDNISSMAEIADNNNVQVILSSILPANNFPWRQSIDPTEEVIKLNMMLRKYAKANNHIYLDYYSFMVDENKGLQNDLGTDGVHPNITGYEMMEGLAVPAINKALAKITD